MSDSTTVTDAARAVARSPIAKVVGFLICVELASGVLQGYYTPIFTDIARHLSIKDADVNWFEAAQLIVSALVVPLLARLAADELHNPLRFVMRPPASALMGFMPAYRGGGNPLFSLKEIVIAPGNPARGLDAHQGAVLLHDGETGRLRALLNASAITEIRTAAVSGVATRVSSRATTADR